MAQFAQIGPVLTNPEGIEFIRLKSDGVVAIRTATGTVFLDAGSIPNPNDLSELQIALNLTEKVNMVVVDDKLVNPANVVTITPFGDNHMKVLFASGDGFITTNLSVSDLLDERVNGQGVTTNGRLDAFALAYNDATSTGPIDYTAQFTPASLYSAQLPDGVTFNSGVISAIPSGVYLITLGLKYTSGTPGVVSRCKLLRNDIEEVGTMRLNYPVASEQVFDSQMFMLNVDVADTFKVIYGDTNPASSSFIVRLSFTKLSSLPAAIPNPADALTIGGISVDFDGNPLVIDNG